MNRILFSKDEIQKPLSVQDTRAIHCIKVLKLKAGDTFEAGIINSFAGIATLTRLDSDFLYFDFHSMGACALPLYPLSLIVGFPRPIQLKRILRDCASLGVDSIHLAGTELGEKSYLSSNLVSRGHAETALLDGIVQAKGTMIPKLFFYTSLAEYFQQVDSCTSTNFLFDTLNPQVHAGEIKQLVNNKSFICAAIGSERGWTNTERALFAKHNFKTCSLGKRILRTETAAIAAVSIITSVLQEPST